jgi:hypothetical protein
MSERPTAKPEQERVIAASSLRSSIVKTTQWREFATNPAAVTSDGDDVLGRAHTTHR